MKKYYIKYNDRREIQQKFITESEYKNIEIARKAKQDQIFIPSIDKTEYLKDFKNDIQIEKDYEVERDLQLDDWEMNEIRDDKDLNENFKQNKKFLEDKYNITFTEGIIYGLKKGIIGFVDGNINFSISNNKQKDFWKVGFVSEYFAKKHYAEKKRLEQLQENN